jgi:hypothetical protein
MGRKVKAKTVRKLEKGLLRDQNLFLKTADKHMKSRKPSTTKKYENLIKQYGIRIRRKSKRLSELRTTYKTQQAKADR